MCDIKMDWIEKFINRIVCGNSATILKQIPSNKIDLVITSPPYFQQREYGSFKNEIGNEDLVEKYILNIIKVFNECVRIIKPTGSVVFNIGDKYNDGNLLLVPYKFAIKAKENNEVKLINAIIWVKTNPTPRQYKRRLVSSTEPFFHFVKSENYYYNTNKFLVENNKRTRRNRSHTKIGQSYFEKIDNSDLTKEQKKKAKNDLVKVIKEVKMGEIESFRMKIRGIHAPAFGGQEGGRQIQLEKQGYTIIRIHGKPLKRDVIESSVETIKGRNHPSIYPEFIIKQFIKLLTKKGDVVLDPFVGSGTTCVASKKLDRKYIGIDINPKYCEDARERVNSISTPLNLFK